MHAGSGLPAHNVARSPEAKLDEAIGLARAIDLAVISAGIVPIADIRPATFIGKGKVEELAGLIKSDEIGIVVMDCALSPVQQRNLEKAWGAKVIDRTGLILEIFGRRAQTREGSLQVEHAHLTYQKSRLVRSWTHLERQRGGFGFLGGPGESQLETDRRLIEERIARIEDELEKVKRTRQLHRDSRKRVPYPMLEEVVAADLILHVRDVSHEDSEAQSQDVETVMRQLGIEPGEQVIEVWNKIDRLNGETRERLGNLADRAGRRAVAVSALTGEGMERLLSEIEGRIASTRIVLDLVLDGADGAGISWLHRNTEVLAKVVRDDGSVAMTVRADKTKAATVRARFGA